jgi:hypothetical protein
MINGACLYRHVRTPSWIIEGGCVWRDMCFGTGRFGQGEILALRARGLFCTSALSSSCFVWCGCAYLARRRPAPSSLPSPKNARTGGVGRPRRCSRRRRSGTDSRRNGTTGPFCVYGTTSCRRNGTNGPCILRTVWGGLGAVLCTGWRTSWNTRSVNKNTQSKVTF